MIWHIFLFMIINKIVICFKKKIVYRNIFHVVRMNLFIQIKIIKWRLIYWKVYENKDYIYFGVFFTVRVVFYAGNLARVFHSQTGYVAIK